MIKKNYINVHIQIKEELYDLAIGFLWQLPIIGIEEKNDELIVTFPIEDFTDELKTRLYEIISENLPGTFVSKEELIEEKNWNEEWESSICPIKIGENIIVSPSWRAVEEKIKFNIIINPKMAFGTGSHSTTKMMCLLLEKIVQKDSFWIDAGTGTGILAILAIKLGAKRVLAIENDSWAIDNASENFEINGLSNYIELIKSDVTNYKLPKADGICANLSIALIQKCWDNFRQSLIENKGDLLLSGLLIYDRDEIMISARKNGFELTQCLTDEEWIAFHFKII